MKHSINKGFTLIELMIVVAIVAILGAIAYPAYTESVLKGKRAQGRTAVVELLQQQERYLTQTNCYQAFSTNGAGVSTAVASCGMSPSPVPFKNFAGDSLTNASYLLSATTCSTGAISDCVQVQAQPIKADAAVGTLTMTSTGVKSCTGSASSTNPKLCWP